MDRLLQNNMILKILAAMLAILLWLSVHSGGDTAGTGAGFAQSSQTLGDKGVTVLYDERSFSLVGQPKVNLVLHGSAVDVMRAVASGTSIEVMADARKLGEGTHEVPVFYQGLPAGVTADSTTVKIRLEANANKEFTIKVVTEGKPKDGLSIGDPIVSPKTVIVTGPSSAVNAVDRVLATLSLADATETLQTSVPLIPVDKNGKTVKDVRLSRERVEVNVPITKPSKTVPLQLQFKGDLAPGFAVEGISQPGSVTIYGPANVLAALDSYPAPPIDLSGLANTTKVRLKLSNNVEGVTAVQPEEVDVEVKVVAAAQRTFQGIPYKVTGLKAGESYTLGSSPDKVNVTVAGAKALLDKLTAQDLNAVVDVSNQPTGTQELRVQVNAPNFVKVTDITPPTVSLEIKK
jgi:YbbR domain-containing protein